MALRVLVSDDLSAEGVAILKAAGLEVDVKVGQKPEELEKIIGGYDALAVRSATKVNKALLEKAERLKVIGRAGVGVDNVDLEAATRKGIVVMNTPGGSSVTVAELTVAMMLSLARNVAQATASVKAGKWEKKKFQGHELSGKTLGVVGIGNIGSVVVERCQGLKMRVVAYDPFISAEAAARLGVTLVTLDELWAQADVISIHVPLNEQTRGLVNAKTIAKMKKTALLVNCARGGIVDEKDLAAALAEGKLGGAALDVFDKEPPAPDNPLFKLDSFICTPHLGASTEEAQAAVAIGICEQLAAYLKNGVVKNAINVPNVPKEIVERVGPYLTLAEKLGSLAGQLAPSGVGSMNVEFAGEVAALPQKPITLMALKGLLQHFMDVPVNEVNAPAIAKDRGIGVRELRSDESPDFASMLTVTVQGQGGEVRVAGAIFGKREARIVRVNQYHLDAYPEGEIIAVENVDAPGVIGNIGGTLGAAGINIARIALSRDSGKAAFSLINVDSAVSAEVMSRIAALPNVKSARRVRL
jgi:D-3-phosphoglycerate dehydrogenase/(S)-sulfolactate dehydrogenase